MTRLTISTPTTDAIRAMSQDNTRSAQVLGRMVSDDELMLGPGALDWLLALDEMGVYGADIWRSYKDFCHENLDIFYAVVTHRDVLFAEFLNDLKTEAKR